MFKKNKKEKCIRDNCSQRHQFLLGDDREDVSLCSWPANQLGWQANHLKAFATGTKENIETTMT